MISSDIEIMNMEVIDNCVYEDPETGMVQPSEISVLVEFSVNKKVFEFDFQTTTTHDYCAYSSTLYPYDVDKLFEIYSDNDVERIIKYVAKKAQAVWHEYVSEHYVTNDDHFGGMDGYSKINEATRK